MTGTPLRGEIWLADFDPTLGHEQSGKRPALVVSVDPFNTGPADLVIVLPITSQDKRIHSHVSITPPEGGLLKTSFIKCEDVRSISKFRLGKRLGKASDETLHKVEFHLQQLLGISQ